MPAGRATLTILLLWTLLPRAALAQPSLTVDLALQPTTSLLARVHGYTGTGATGVPVSGGHDCDGDGFRDAAFASFRADPAGRTDAGEIYLVFGDGTVSGTLDAGVAQARILRIHGDIALEMAGSEIWMDDVTGDGLGDLLIARQNYSPDATRIGAGALSVLVGGPELAAHAATLQPVDLRAPPPALTVRTFVGAEVLGRLGIWMRTGDVTGDGVADLLIGADQEGGGLGTHRGAGYLVRGGPLLAANGSVDLADFGTGAFAATGFDGHVVRVGPPTTADDHDHLGATVQIADLDGDGRGEVLLAAAINRSGAALEAAGAPAGSAHGTGGTADGSLYIAWADNFTGNPWPLGFAFAFDASPGTRSIVHGGLLNRDFGEELLGGLDYDADGKPDLFVGDIVGDLSGVRPNAGSAHVLYDAASLKGLEFDLDSPPPALVKSDFLGAAAGHIAGDTAAHGDFDGDGIDDLMFTSPHASPRGRGEAGTLHVFFGQAGPWPASVDLAALPPPASVRITEVHGANGSSGSDIGDVLGYSAAVGDFDGDQRVDIVVNEMLGNGTSSDDVGNLLLVSGRLLSPILATACGNTLDDDGDLHADYPVDPGCQSADDDDELGEVACDDDADNDGDGFVDHPDDPGCGSPSGVREQPQCQDGIDNDGQLGIDFDGGASLNGGVAIDVPDPQCTSASRNREGMQTVWGCGLGPELALLLPVLGWLGRRRSARRDGGACRARTCDLRGVNTAL